MTAAVLQVCLKRNFYRIITEPEATKLIEFFRILITKVSMLAFTVQIVVVEALEKAIQSAFAYGVVSAIVCLITTLCLRDCQLGNHSSKISLP